MFKISRRMAVLYGVVVPILSLAVSPATAQSQQQIDWCINAAHGFSPDQQISGCTAAIQSGKWSGRGLAWAFNNRGFAYYLKDELDPAFADFEQAIRLDPNDAIAFNNRGLIYQSKGDLARAIADYDETIRLDPTYVFAFNNRGGAYAGKNEYDHAIADYSEAIRLDPTFAVAIKARGNAMRFARAGSPNGHLSALQTFECRPCGLSLTAEAVLEVCAKWRHQR
jgi:tetratricopeptide (TPR) repeat protein